MKSIVLDTLEESIRVKDRFIKDNIPLILRGADMLVSCITSGHKILIFGNGGSAADAQHIAAEFVNRFQIERPPLAALALTTDTSIITSIGNDYNFDEIFSKNVIQAIHAAGKIGMVTIGLTGRGGALAQCADLVFSVKSDITARVQEAHIILGHILCDLVDRILFPEKFGNLDSCRIFETPNYVAEI